MITFKKREIIYRPYEGILKFIVDCIMLICLAYLLVMAFFDHTSIAGHSMNNTLENGDTVLINKASYSYEEPKRYDVIVFEPTIGNVSKFYVKRIIGLPGETVQIKDGFVYIDGNKLANDVISTEIFNPGLAKDPIKLQYDEYFVLGDNRNNSDDSRFSNVGLVKRGTIIGKPWIVVSPFSNFGPVTINEMTNENKSEE